MLLDNTPGYRYPVGHIQSCCTCRLGGQQHLNPWEGEALLGRELLASFVLALVLTAPTLHADYYFYGVGNNEAWHASYDLFDALEALPEWTDPGDEHCIQRINRIAWDGGSGNSMMYDLYWYANNLEAGDVFLFSYGGHGGWNLVDNNDDEGDTARPQSNDPTPANISLIHLTLTIRCLTTTSGFLTTLMRTLR